MKDCELDCHWEQVQCAKSKFSLHEKKPYVARPYVVKNKKMSKMIFLQLFAAVLATNDDGFCDIDENLVVTLHCTGGCKIYFVFCAFEGGPSAKFFSSYLKK